MFSRAQDVRWPRLALRCAPAAADVETRRVRQRGALKSCSALYVKMDLQHGPLTKLALCVNKHSTLSGLLTLLLLLLLLLPLRRWPAIQARLCSAGGFKRKSGVPTCR